jgi:hypothetical protein
MHKLIRNTITTTTVNLSKEECSWHLPNPCFLVNDNEEKDKTLLGAHQQYSEEKAMLFLKEISSKMLFAPLFYGSITNNMNAMIRTVSQRLPVLNINLG